MPNINNTIVHYYDYGVDQLAYFDAGAGPVNLLLIHGFGEDHTIWEKQIEFLSPHFRIIAPNLPGVHCKTLPLHHTQEPSIRNYVEVLHELMHHLHIEKYYIMGHSMGGYIGLAFADYYVNHVMGLGLIHSTTYADSDAKKASRLKVAEFIEEFGTLKYLETATVNLFGSAFKNNHPSQIQHMIDNASEISESTMMQFVFAMRNRNPMTHLLTQRRMPVWMIAGKEDIAVPLEDSMEQLALLPKEHAILLDGVGHMGMLEATEQVNKSIYTFIQNEITK